MEIDATAPVRAQAEVHIAAAPDEVWAVLSDIERWPTWNPDVREVTVQGPLAPGTIFTWRGGGRRITSTLREARAPLELGWSGRTSGVTAEHVYRLEPHRGGTWVITSESWSGLWPRLLPSRAERLLQRSLEKGLDYLDAEFGRRAIAAAAHELQAHGRTEPGERPELEPPEVVPPELGPAEAA